ncbi:MAG: PQQ-dependent sugar dehydrogenase [Cytophagaceae bacterium]|jgi:glucose/arabinose dehydrogenase|nr:PQQ-dependent sugar dehydrogenase [Cytophagaceae bacterium]
MTYLFTSRFGNTKGVANGNPIPRNKLFHVIFIISMVLSLGLLAQLPAGFVLREVAPRAFTRALAIAHAPDGRIFVAEKTGAIKVVQNGVVSTITTIPTNTQGENGLLGITLHPNFSSNGRVYIFYTNADFTFHLIDYFSVSTTNQVSARTNILRLDAITNIFHNGGGLVFVNGNLYVACGENFAASSVLMSWESTKGKILRLTDEGQPAPGNPYFGEAGASRIRRSIWAIGFRNPFSMTVDRVRNRIYVNDVGTSWEEINDITSPDPARNYNYGWGAPNGGDGAGVATSSNTIPPIYNHRTGFFGGGCSAITGGLIYSPAVATNYPAQFRDQFFFSEWCNSWFKTFPISNPSAPTSDFGTNLNFNKALCLSIGNDGNIYFVRHNENPNLEGTLFRIEYTLQSAPQILSQPASRTVNVGDAVSFSVTASGAAPLIYQWQRNGVNIVGATSASYSISAATAAAAGSYTCIVSNTSGTVTSNVATLVVNAFNATPVVDILTPISSQTWNVGNIISYSGSATDAEDGVLPAANYEWEVLLFHQDCATCGHSHPGPNAPDGVTSGSFVADNGGEPSPNIWVRLFLRVRDSQGRVGVDSVDLQPNKVDLTFNSTPVSAQITAGSNLLVASPFTRPFVVNATITLAASTTAMSGSGTTYNFSSWNIGGTASRTLTVPATATTYTATYTEAINTQTPFGGTAAAIPGTVLVQNYDLGGQGIAYNDLTTGNAGNQYRTTEAVDLEPCSEGGFNIGWAQATEWTEYTVNVSQTGSYSVAFRVSTPLTGRTAHLEINGVNISGPVSLPATGGYQAWQTVTVPSVNLTAGTQVLRLVMDSDNFNISRLVFTLNGANTPPTVSLTAPAANASFTAPASITISATAADANGTVSQVEFFQGTTRLGVDLTAPYSFTWTGVAAGAYSITARATDNAGATTTSAAVAVTVTAAATQTPYGGTVKSIPGRIEAEEYDLGGQGVAFNDGSAANLGGVFRTDGVDIQATADANGAFNVGWTTAGEWLEYSVNVQTAGVYTLTLRVATVAAGNTIAVSMDGSNITSAPVSLPLTGGWQTWQTVIVPNVSLSAGNRILRLTFVQGGVNLNFVSFALPAPIFTDVNEATDANAVLSVYPNPASSEMTVKVPASSNISELSISDANGKVVYSRSLPARSEAQELHVDCSSFDAGTYFIKVVQNGKTISQKFMKK